MGRPPIGKSAMTVAERQRRHRRRRAQVEEFRDMAEVLKVSPLPATTEDLIPLRKLKARRTINDMVEDIVVKLWDDEDFRRLVDGVTDSDCTEGSMDIDDVLA